MPTLLVIDDEPAFRLSIRAAVPDWTILEAEDGVVGLLIARQQLATLDLVLLDINMPGLDGYHTCLQLRALSCTLPIVPFTAVVEAVPFLGELGCLPPVFKTASLDELRAALHAAVGQAPPPLQPGAALLTFAQQQASERERTVRAEWMQRLALFATNPVTRLGLRQLLTAAGATLVHEATSAAALQHLLETTTPRALVADARDRAIALAALNGNAPPLLLVAATLPDGLAALADRRVHGVVLATDQVIAALAAALDAVSVGEHYRSPELAAPFKHLGLTPQEQQHLALEAQGRAPAEIAQDLGVDVKTVYQYRHRLRAKLGLDKDVDLARWAAE
jgi:DNA-binding NarL/FixJ family response regulator